MKKLDARVVWVFFLKTAFRSIFFIIFLLVWTSAMSDSLGVLVSIFSTPILIFIGVVIWLAICYMWAQWTYNFYGYELTDIGFKKESGIINKKYVTIPFDRIQNVDINRGIISRFFGLSDISIQTAGSSAVMGRYGASGVGGEGYLPGLSKETAEQLRDELITRAHKSKNQGM